MYLWPQIPNGPPQYCQVLLPYSHNEFTFALLKLTPSCLPYLPTSDTLIYSAFPAIAAKEVALVDGPDTLDLNFSLLSRVSFQQLSYLSSKHQSLTLSGFLGFSTQTHCHIIHLKENRLILYFMIPISLPPYLAVYIKRSLYSMDFLPHFPLSP